MNKKQDTTVAGITYSKPTVVLLQDTGIGTAELAARTCYDSFDSSENGCVKSFSMPTELATLNHQGRLDAINNITHSDLLDTLAWTHFHHSILEHANLTYLIKGTSRGVLQEHARHRLQAISVRSTRYTMSSVINAYVASRRDHYAFSNILETLDLFVTTNIDYNKLQIADIFNKLKYQEDTLGTEEFNKLAVAKSSLETLDGPMSVDARFLMLQAGKKKRNVGDSFKHIVNDNWKVDMVVTFNLRSLKNYFNLRSSSSAYFQIHWLANEMIKITPRKYLDLILKQDKLTKVISWLSA